jgi:hypothetical protein
MYVTTQWFGCKCKKSLSVVSKIAPAARVQAAIHKSLFDKTRAPPGSRCEARAISTYESITVRSLISIVTILSNINATAFLLSVPQPLRPANTHSSPWLTILTKGRWTAWERSKVLSMYRPSCLPRTRCNKTLVSSKNGCALTREAPLPSHQSLRRFPLLAKRQRKRQRLASGFRHLCF